MDLSHTHPAGDAMTWRVWWGLRRKPLGAAACLGAALQTALQPRHRGPLRAPPDVVWPALSWRPCVRHPCR
eukprot:6619304-Karenia_brevis.AAC.1